jgi:cysteine-rich repeat protein
MSTVWSRSVLVVTGLLAVLGAAADAEQAETYLPAHTFLNPGPSPGAMGDAVALSGTEALVGTAGPTFISQGVLGRVHVFDVVSGALLRTVSDPTGALRTSFGAAIAPVDANILVGAPDTTGGGAAYLVDSSGAVLHTFTSPTLGTTQFGGYVGTLGGDILIGTRFFDGGAEVFDATTYAHLRTLSGPFNIRATLGPNLVVSPSPGHVELRDGMTNAVIRVFADPVVGGSFGDAAAVVGTGTIVIGDSDEAGIEPGEGAAYAFDSATGALLYTLHPPDTYENFGFGSPMAAAGSTLFVTASRGGEDGAGEVVMYDGTTGTLLRELTPPHPPQLGSLSTAHRFGEAVAVDGERVLIGTPQDFRSPATPGVAHLYDRCGNGNRAAGEECDDGNTTDGDGCSAHCRLEVCGNVPRTDCHVAERAGLVLFDPYVVYNIHAKVRWSWMAGGGAMPVDFGDPTASATNVFCLYAGPAPGLQVTALPGGSCGGRPCWGGSPSSFHYRNPDVTPDGAFDVRLKARGTTTQLRLVGIGETLHIPDRSCPHCPIPYAGNVTAQLVNTETGACWSSTFTPASYKNANGKLSAKLP